MAFANKLLDPEALMSRTVMSDTTLNLNDNEPKTFITSGLTTFADFSNSSEKYLVTLDDTEDPKHFPEYKKWVAVAVIAAGAFCATSASSMVRVTRLHNSGMLWTDVILRRLPSLSQVKSALCMRATKLPFWVSVSSFLV